MRAGVALLVLVGCTRSVQPTISAAPAPSRDVTPIDGAVGVLPSARPVFDYCGMVLASIEQAVAPYRNDMETLETPCVQSNVTANGVWYAEAVGFDPMPTLTCKSGPWIVQIGETPPRAPTDAIVLIGFSDRGAQQFSARVERSDWRKQPNRFSNYGCGSVSGIVRRVSDRWVAKLTSNR